MDIKILKIILLSIFCVILFSLNYSCVQKNQMTRKEVSVWCKDYVNNPNIIKSGDQTDQELFDQCMELYGYGKNN